MIGRGLVKDNLSIMIAFKSDRRRHALRQNGGRMGGSREPPIRPPFWRRAWRLLSDLKAIIIDRLSLTSPLPIIIDSLSETIGHPMAQHFLLSPAARSEERRVGKE